MTLFIHLLNAPSQDGGKIEISCEEKETHRSGGLCPQESLVRAVRRPERAVMRRIFTELNVAMITIS